MQRALLLIFIVSAFSCSKTTPPATAFQVKARADLVGGQRALGEIGDFKLSNGIIHAIVQDVGTSRGFGAFGGSLIDLDLVRGLPATQTGGPQGNDYFTEMFPAFFLLAIEPSKVEVIADGSDGQAAIVRVSGDGGDFISIVSSINQLLVPKQHLTYHVDYILEPGKQYLKVVTTVKNVDTTPAGFALEIPFGFVTLLGEGQRLFLPNEAGYDVRFHLDEVYKRTAMLTSLPGEIVPMITTEGPGVSYAVASAPKGASYMNSHPEFYSPYVPAGEKLSNDVLVPIASSSFLGSFWGKPPAMLNPGQEYSYIGYVAVGSGDVTSAQKVIWAIDDQMGGTDKDPNGGRAPYHYATISGRVREKATLLPMVGTSVVLVDDNGRYASQARTIEGGIYTATVPPGRYTAYAVDSLRDVACPGSTKCRPGDKQGSYVSVQADQKDELDIEMSSPATLTVAVTDERGRPLPSKISVEGKFPEALPGLPRDSFYSLPLGEKFRNTTLVDGDQRYLETYFFAPLGTAGKFIRPGHYKVYASRGPEYSLESMEVDLVANQTTTVELKLTQEMPTDGWISGDFHVHSINSVDSFYALPDRVTSYAVEGVDLVTSTDHNYVADYKPTIEALGLQDWLASQIGLELTTLEMGHFNGYPLMLQPGPVTHGSFAWFMRPPAELFAQLRGLGVDQSNTVVQVNHPTDTVLGYFSEFNMGIYTAEPYAEGSFSLDQSALKDGGIGPYDPRQFSLDFDALEVFNGKRDLLLYSYRVPDVAPVGPTQANPFCRDMPGMTTDCVPDAGMLELTALKTLDGGTYVQPAYPGALDAWYGVLAHGHKVTAMGNSDSHSSSAEAGLPRTYVKVGPSADGSMRGLAVDAVPKAILEGHTVVTNGPFIEADVNGTEIGGTAVRPDGTISVHVKVKAASWVDVSRVRIKRGGPDAVSPVLLKEIVVPRSTNVVRLEDTYAFSGIPDKSFVVIEVSGDDTMWPVFTPYEISEILISDAVSVIGGSFGYSNKWGKYRPSQTNPVHPFGFTNPIWISYSSDQPLKAPKKVLPVGASEPFKPRALGDLRKLFHQFHSDP